MHSLKDLPTESPDGLEIVAQLEREDPRDVLVVNRRRGAESLDDLPAGSRVGTSSLRRRAQLLGAAAGSRSRRAAGQRSDAARESRERAGARGDSRRGRTHSPRGRSSGSQCSSSRRIGFRPRGRARSQFRSGATMPGCAICCAARSRADVDCDARRARVSRGAGRWVPGADRRARDAIGRRAYIIWYARDLSGTHIVRGSAPLDADAPESTGEALAAEIRSRGGSSLLVELRQLSKFPAPQPE